MARWLGVLAVSVLVLTGLLVSRPASSQDNHEERIATLETQVAVLGDDSGGDRTLYGLLLFSGTPGVVNVSQLGVSCYGIGNMSDLAPGSRVSATTDSGRVVLESRLKPGQLPPSVGPDGGLVMFAQCAMSFEIPGIEYGKDYRLDFGSGRTAFLARDALVSAAYVVTIPVY